MTDISRATWASPAITLRRPGWLGALVHRTEILRRRARRNRYLALAGRSPGRYPWFEALFSGMSGR
jgi:hypothetical protein